MVAKNHPRLLSKHIPEILIGVGVLFLVLSVVHNVIRIKTLRLDARTVQSYLANSRSNSQDVNYPVHVEIPWFVNVDITPQIYSRGEWTISPNFASYLTVSALPGEPGNIIIYGHNTREILGNIRALKGSEKITLTMSNGTKREYIITSLQQVASSQVELLAPTNTETLTIYTCSGIMDSQRFVVRATPITSK